jgi:hypothetical protein
MVLKRTILALAAATAVGAAQAQSKSVPDDWATFSKLLAVVQVLVNVAAASQDDPLAAQRAIDDLIGGRNPEANALASEIFAGVPPAERERLLGIARSMVALGRKQAGPGEPGAGDAAALQARKDLTAIGLTYYDRGQFLEAVKRGDLVAVRLFLAGRGIDPAAKDLLGNTALDVARREGNAEMIALLSGAIARRASQQSP